MNEKQPYEKHLSEKLDQLAQSGDANKHWPQMKTLLDREQPEGRPGRWWLYGIIAGIIITGALLSISFLRTSEKEYAIAAGSVVNEKNASTENMLPVKKEDNTTATNNVITSKSKVVTDQPVPGQSTELIKTNQPENNNLVDNKSNSAEKNNPASHTSPEKGDPVIDAKNDIPKFTTLHTSDKKDKNAVLPRTMGNNIIIIREENKGIQTDSKNLVVKNEDKAGNRSNSDIIKKSTRPGYIIKNQEAALSQLSGIEENNSNKKTINKNRALSNTEIEPDLRAARVSQSILPNSFTIMGPKGIIPDSLTSDYTSLVQSMPSLPIVRSRFKINSDRVKGLKNRVVGTGDNKNFVLGISLPLAFPLSDQKVVAYNFTGGANTALDYLPVPHVQYHINQKSYLQAEVQFVSPQYIQPALLAQSKYEIAGGTTGSYRFVTNSVFARKLFYFNLPIGIHYSPFKNFYLGSGVQFSSLLSGIAMQEIRGYNSLGPSASDSLFSQRFSKFKNDSLSGSLTSNEFRVMLDANYYWHRFTVGLRYNQAVNNYVSIRVNNTSPLFTDKNKSMQFYLRYNLWEDKKRKKSGLMAER